MEESVSSYHTHQTRSLYELRIHVRAMSVVEASRPEKKKRKKTENDQWTYTQEYINMYAEHMLYT